MTPTPAQLLPQTLHGETVRSAQCGAVTATEKLYAPGTRLPRHSHATSRFCLLLSGAYSESWQSSLRTRRPGALTFHPAGEEHSSLFHSPVRCVHLELSPALPLPWKSLSQPLDCLERPLAGQVRRLQLEWEDQDDFSLLALESLTYDLLISAGRTGPPRSVPTVLAGLAMEIIQERFAAPLTLSDIAHSLDVHPVYLARVFRQAFRRSVGDAIRDARIQFALAEIRRNTTPLADIALSAGFTDQSHMTRTLRRFTGRTPSQFRV